MTRPLASSLTIAGFFFATSADAAFTREPWIQDATKDSVTIAWEGGAAGGTQSLTWGAGTALDQTTPGTLVSTWLYTATVTGLPASSVFSYKVTSGADQSATGSFVTAPDHAEPFRFGVTGDNRSDPAGHASVVAATIPYAPDFMLNTGDIVDGTDYTEFFDIEKELLRNSVIFPSPGNHDAPTEYAYGFNRPQYYSFRWGNAFYLSVNSDGDYSSGSVQLQWIEAQLVAAKADTTIQWIFAFHHHPVYSSGEHGNTASVIADLNPLFIANGVDMVFNGHDHNYERIENDGVVYVVAGGGGVSPRSMGAPVTGAVISESVRHTVIVDIDGGVLNMRAFRPDGTLIDEREIVKGPVSGEPGGPEDPTDPEDPSDPSDPATEAPGEMAGGCACAIGATTPARLGGFLPAALLLAGVVLARRKR